MGSGAKPHKSRCCLTACAVILALLLVSSLGGLGGVSYFLRRLVPFTDVGVLKTLTGCGRCPECMACLSGFTGEDVNALCDPLANVFQCVVQFFYLYDRDDYGQPCYDECHACEECLDATTFGALGKLDKTLWETTFPDFLHTPESMGLDNYTVDCSDESQDVCMLLFNASDSFHERQKRQASLDMGCETASEVLPYTLVHRDAEGTTWYPIWFNIPWNELPRQYQFYHRVECLQTNGFQTQSCGPSLQCQAAGRSATFLMSSKTPHRRYGFTYQFLVLPDKKVKFMEFHLPSYCHCVN